MCHQSVGLIQAAIESAGITTVSLSVTEEITSKVGPPRVLQVPFPFGFPLGAANDPELQHSIIDAALTLLESAGPPPVTARFSASG